MAYDLMKEKREAIDAGHRALNSLYAAREQLNSARNWGFADLLGGGFLISLVKHSKMEEANRYMNQAKYDLRTFSNELQDITDYGNFEINTNDFITFADFFFDGFVADWMSQNKINTARKQVDDAILRVEGILQRLN